MKMIIIYDVVVAVVVVVVDSRQWEMVAANL